MKTAISMLHTAIAKTIKAGRRRRYYREPDGKRCVIGHLIQDHAYTEVLEGKTVLHEAVMQTLPGALQATRYWETLTILQGWNDRLPEFFTPTEALDSLKLNLAEHNLNFGQIELEVNTGLTFDNMAHIYPAIVKVLQQGCRSFEDGRCAYRTTTGNKCVIGHMIQDAHYTEDMEGRGVDRPSVWPVMTALGFDLAAQSALANLQTWHDNLIRETHEDDATWVARVLENLPDWVNRATVEELYKDGQPQPQPNKEPTMQVITQIKLADLESGSSTKTQKFYIEQGVRCILESILPNLEGWESVWTKLRIGLEKHYQCSSNTASSILHAAKDGKYISENEVEVQTSNYHATVTVSAITLYTIQDCLMFTNSKSKVGAIRALRRDTGWGLKEAKDFIDNLTEAQINAAIEDIYFATFERV